MSLVLFNKMMKNYVLGQGTCVHIIVKSMLRVNILLAVDAMKRRKKNPTRQKHRNALKLITHISLVLQRHTDSSVSLCQSILPVLQVAITVARTVTISAIVLTRKQQS